MAKLPSPRLRLALLAGLLLLAGCAGPGPYAHQPREQRFVRDIYSCLHTGRTASPAEGWQVERSRYHACMMARGWDRSGAELPAVAATN